MLSPFPSLFVWFTVGCSAFWFQRGGKDAAFQMQSYRWPREGLLSLCCDVRLERSSGSCLWHSTLEAGTHSLDSWVPATKRGPFPRTWLLHVLVGGGNFPYTCFPAKALYRRQLVLRFAFWSSGLDWPQSLSLSIHSNSQVLIPSNKV